MSTPEPERDPVENQPTAKRSWVLPAALGAAGLLLGLGIGGAVGAAATSTAIEAGERNAAAAEEASVDRLRASFFADAAGECKVKTVVAVEDDGNTMIVDGKGEEVLSGDVAFDSLDCIIDAVGAPASVKQLMYETRSLDGRQSESWTSQGIELEASWSYHPDDGLDIIFKLAD